MLHVGVTSFETLKIERQARKTGYEFPDANDQMCDLISAESEERGFGQGYEQFGEVIRTEVDVDGVVKHLKLKGLEVSRHECVLDSKALVELVVLAYKTVGRRRTISVRVYLLQFAGTCAERRGAGEGVVYARPFGGTALPDRGHDTSCNENHRVLCAKCFDLSWTLHTSWVPVCGILAPV